MLIEYAPARKLRFFAICEREGYRHKRTLWVEKLHHLAGYTSHRGRSQRSLTMQLCNPMEWWGSHRRTSRMELSMPLRASRHVVFRCITTVRILILRSTLLWNMERASIQWQRAWRTQFAIMWKKRLGLE